MNRFISALLTLLIVSCSKKPNCKYEGDFYGESNAGCLAIYNSRVLFVEDWDGRLALPGGGMAFGEAPQCTAEREVWEETGIEVIANDKITTFENGFQLFECEIIGSPVLDGSNRSSLFEINDIHWLAENEFDEQVWRFPKQVEFIRHRLISSEKVRP